MRRIRLALLAAATATATVASLAGAATPTAKPQLTDPAGDAVALGSGFDIVSGVMSTTGKGKGASYKPTALVATLTLAGPPTKTPGGAISFDMDTSGCGGGSFSYSYTPGAALGDGYLFITGCGTTTPGSSGTSEILSDVVPVVAGNTITWTMPLADLDKSEMPIGATFTNFTASSNVNEPVFGIIGTGIVAGVDDATGDGTYKLN